MGEEITGGESMTREEYVKWLEQQTCEDAVSREAVLNALGGPSKVADDNFDKMRERIRIINIINKLPSVNPQPMTGHWIYCYTNGFGRKIYKCFTTASGRGK